MDHMDPHGTFEENMEIRKPERKTPKPKHTQHAEPVRIASVTPIKSTSLLPSNASPCLDPSPLRSSSSLSARGAQTNKLRTRSTKRRLEFGDVEAKESLEAPLAIPVSNKRKRRNKGGEGQGVVSAATAAAFPGPPHLCDLDKTFN